MTKPNRQIEGSRDQRSILADFRAADNDDDRVIDISVSSEIGVERWFGTEILVHEKKAINLDFFGGKRAPLLLDHDHSKVIGVVESVSLDETERKLRARVRFGRSALAQEILDDVRDGIRSNISIGYVIEKIERDEKKNTVRVVRWMPYETSIVSVPADQTVGVGRSADAVDQTVTQVEAIMPDENNTPATVPATVENRSAPPATSTLTVNTPAGPMEVRFTEAQVTQMRSDAAEITALGAKHNMSDKARDAIRDGLSLGEFRGMVLNALPNGTPLESNDIGMTQREVDRFSVFRLARASHPQATQSERDAAKFEIEATQAAAEMAEKTGHKVRGSSLPAEIMRNWIPRNSSMYHQKFGERVINTTDDAALVPEDFRPGSFIDVLRNSMSVMQAGATVLNGLQGNVDIPKKLTASSGAWVATEGGNAGSSEPTFGNVTMTPKDIAVYTDLTRRARQQMSPDVEALVRMDITMAIALGLDLAALEGSGASGQPRGVLNTVGINRPTAFAAANPTYAEVVALETEVANDNALMGNLAYIIRTNMAGALKTTEKFAGTGMTVWEPGNTLNGYNAIRSNQGTSGNLYFGNWSDLLIGFWSGLDLQFDYAALALSGGLRLIAFQTCDVAVRQAQSFAWNKNGV